MMEYIKLFWEDAPEGEPSVILYEVDTKNERLVRGVIREFEENNSGEDLFHFDSDEDVFCVYSQ